MVDGLRAPDTLKRNGVNYIFKKVWVCRIALSWDINYSTCLLIYQFIKFNMFIIREKNYDGLRELDTLMPGIINVVPKFGPFQTLP